MSQFIITETIPYPKEILKILEENKELKEENKLMKEELDGAELEEYDKEELLDRIYLLEEVDKKQLILLKNQQEELKVAKGLIKKLLKKNNIIY